MTTATLEKNGASAKTVQTEADAPDAWAALVALQGDLPVIHFDKVNPHFKSSYASLAGIMQAVRPVMARHGFAWITQPGSHALEYTLIHSNGTVVANGFYPLPEQAKPQELGSAITYARRYALSAVLGIVADEDDDGEAANASSRPTQRSQAPSGARPVPAPQPITQGAYQEGDECPAEHDPAPWPAKFKRAAGGFHKGELQCSGKVDGQWVNHLAPVAPVEREAAAAMSDDFPF